MGISRNHFNNDDKNINRKSFRNKNFRKRSQKQEERIARNLNAIPTVGSGAFDFQKGDIQLRDFLIECKSTIKDFIVIPHKWINKIKKEASDQLKRYALIFTINHKNTLEKDWVVIPEKFFHKNFNIKYVNFEKYKKNYKSQTFGIRIKSDYLNKEYSENKKESCFKIDFLENKCFIVTFKLFKEKINKKNKEYE